jgi:hypothetical protein
MPIDPERAKIVFERLFHTVVLNQENVQTPIVDFLMKERKAGDGTDLSIRNAQFVAMLKEMAAMRDGRLTTHQGLVAQERDELADVLTDE